MKKDETIRALRNALEGMLKEHGWLSDPECQPVDCECKACTEAHRVLGERP